jgi:hypothetical protein
MLHDPVRSIRREGLESTDSAPPELGASGRARATRLLRSLAAEPVTHFILLGVLLFLAASAWQAHQRTHRIEVTPAHVAELARKYALQFGGLPDTPTLNALVRDDLHDEVLFRQGLTDGLDRGDEIVRRRIIQKETFLIQNLAAPSEPTEAQLTRFYADHASRYWTPQQATFSHVYFADDRGGPAAAEARAQAVLKALPADVSRAPDRGDPFPDLYDFSAYEPEQVARLFGHSPFAQAVYTAPIGRWSGPYRSAFGWHLMRVDARTPPGEAPLNTVRDRVREDYLQEAQDKANTAAFARVARRFTIVRKDQP